MRCYPSRHTLMISDGLQPLTHKTMICQKCENIWTVFWATVFLVNSMSGCSDIHLSLQHVQTLHWFCSPLYCSELSQWICLPKKMLWQWSLWHPSGTPLVHPGFVPMPSGMHLWRMMPTVPHSNTVLTPCNHSPWSSSLVCCLLCPVLNGQFIYSGSKNCPNVCAFWKDWYCMKE